MQNMDHASLLEFAREGSLVGIRVGHSRRFVESILGLPKTWGMPPSLIENAKIWKYGDIEFHFCNDELWMIFADTFEVPTGGSSLNLDPWVIRYGMPQQEFERELRKEHITFSCSDSRHNVGELVVMTNAKVCFTFRRSVNDYGPAGLCVMQSQHANVG